MNKCTVKNCNGVVVLSIPNVNQLIVQRRGRCDRIRASVPTPRSDHRLALQRNRKQQWGGIGRRTLVVGDRLLGARAVSVA